VDGPHDIGGRDGFGPVRSTPGYRPFPTEWERRIFGVALALVGQRVMTMDEVRYARERMAPAEYLGSRYFEQWLASVETCLDEAGVHSMTEVDCGVAALAAAPVDNRPNLPRPELLDQLLTTMRRGLPRGEPPRVKASYSPGDSVRTISYSAPGHSRLPQYARGREGRVTAVLEPRPIPDRATHGEGTDPVPVYRVRFDGEELWGPRAEPHTTVDLDLWESYLRPLTEGTP
jgi:nitrile hydratase subunit beta